MSKEDSPILSQEGARRRRLPRLLGHREQQGRTPMESREYFGHIGRIVTNISVAKGGYEGWWVVGSLGKAAVTENPFDHIRSDGSLRDIDVLFSYPNLPISEWLWRNNETPVHIGTGMGNYMKVEPGKGAKLFFGPVEKEVPIEAFPTVMANVGGVVFPTLPPETLFHLQAARPKWRQQDLSSMIDIAVYLKAHRDRAKYPEALYTAFHEYMDMLRDAGVRNSLMYRLKDLADRYQESRMNNIFSISHPVIRRPIEETYDLISRRQRARRKSANEDLTDERASQAIFYNYPDPQDVVSLFRNKDRTEEVFIRRINGIGAVFWRNTTLGNVQVDREDFEPAFGEKVIGSIRPGDTFLDVGAAEGLHAIIAARAGAGRVYAAEPEPKNLWKLEKNLSVNPDVADKVFVMPLALGASDSGTIDLYTNPDHITAARQVDVRTVDEFIEERKMVPPDIVKIDVGGAEGLVLRGMRKTLTSQRKPRHLFVEIHSFLLPKFGTSLGEIMDQIADMGYRMVGEPIVLNDDFQYHFVPNG